MLGPHLGAGLSFSHKFLLAYLTRSARVVPNLHICISDVRDVAIAHVTILETPNAVGRYIICNKAISHGSMLQVVHENFHDLVLPTRKISDTMAKLLTSMDKSGRGELISYNIGRVPSMDCSRTISLGISMRPSSQTIVDTCRYLIEENHLEGSRSGSGCIIA